jgi:hypothetical protein
MPQQFSQRQKLRFLPQLVQHGQEIPQHGLLRCGIEKRVKKIALPPA